MGRDIAVAIFIVCLFSAAFALGGPHQETLTYSSATYSTVNYSCDTSDTRCTWANGAYTCDCNNKLKAFDKSMSTYKYVQNNGGYAQVTLISWVTLDWPLKGDPDERDVAGVFFEAKTKGISSGWGTSGYAKVKNYDTGGWTTAVPITAKINAHTDTKGFSGATAAKYINATDGEMKLKAKLGGSRGWTSVASQPQFHELRPINLTYSYNYAPVIDSFTGPSGLKKGGNKLVFNVTAWNDTDGDYGKLRVCNTSYISNGTCDNGTWCQTSGWMTAPNSISCSFTLTGTENETNKYYMFVCDDYDWDCSEAATGNFTMSYGPYVENVTITPTSPYRITTLTGFGDYGHVDNFTQKGSVLTWWVNSVTKKNETMLEGNWHNSSTFSPSEGGFAVGDTVKFGFRACDQVGECAPMKYATTTIVNAPPVIDLSEKPSYYSNEDVAITADIYNLDNDTLTVVWQWWLNSILTPNTGFSFPKAYGYTRGDNVSYKVNATDGIDTETKTGTIIIANYPPRFESHSITAPAYRNTSLSCSWELIDIEEASFTATARWHKNGAHVAAWDSTVNCTNATLCSAGTIVSGKNVSFGDEFVCEVTASDGIDATASNATAIVAAYCGNGIVEGAEKCDGSAPAGKKCVDCALKNKNKNDPGGGGGGGSLSEEDKSVDSTGETIVWPPVIDLGVATLTRDFGYDSKFITSEYSEIDTYITEDVEFSGELRNVEYTIEIPKGFAEHASEITVEGAEHTVLEEDPVLQLHIGNVLAGETVSIKYIIETEVLKYTMQELVLGMGVPKLRYEEPTPVIAAVPIVPTPTPTPKPTSVPSPAPEKADFTGLLGLATGPFAWGLLLFLVAVFAYKKKAIIISAAPKVKVRRLIRLTAKKPVPKPIAMPLKFPASRRRKTELVKQIAVGLEAKEGKFHAAGIWRELHKAYGNSVVRDRIYIEKDIGDWLREEANFLDSYRNAKYYTFKRGDN
ncbi:MAG: hypothetical protein KAW41_02915 [Candidatus Diapherotrites archaeon]|nr:hypothetical protein [Candidatus Diapherotrites archaeon]